MKAENPAWGAPRIHGELLQLGFTIAEPTVSRYLQQLKRRPDEGKAQQWLPFLNNHREVIGALDFFTVPSLTFRSLYCLLLFCHRARSTASPALQCHDTPDERLDRATTSPSSSSSLPLPVHLFDRDGKFGSDVFEFLRASGIRPIRTSARSPWQNGIAERWIGSARREILDYIIPLNERHLRRLGRDYLAYYHEDRTHIGLEKTTPAKRSVEARPNRACNVLALPRNGGLHHRYTWSQAA